MNAISAGREGHVNTIVDQDASLAACSHPNAPPNQIAEAPVVQVALANLDEIDARIRGSAHERNQRGQTFVRRCLEPMTIRHQAAEWARGERATPLANHRFA